MILYYVKCNKRLAYKFDQNVKMRTNVESMQSKNFCLKWILFGIVCHYEYIVIKHANNNVYNILLTLLKINSNSNSTKLYLEISFKINICMSIYGYKYIRDIRNGWNAYLSVWHSSLRSSVQERVQLFFKIWKQYVIAFKKQSRI